MTYLELVERAAKYVNETTGLDQPPFAPTLPEQNAARLKRAAEAWEQVRHIYADANSTPLYDDARMPDAAEVRVTEEMIEAGLQCDHGWFPRIGMARDIIASIYRAMHAVARMPDAAEVRVTEEMIEVGLQCDRGWFPRIGMARDIIASIYRAMHAVAPPDIPRREIRSDAADALAYAFAKPGARDTRFAVLKAEVAALQMKFEDYRRTALERVGFLESETTRLNDLLKLRTDERDDARRDATRLQGENSDLRGVLHEARLARLHHEMLCEQRDEIVALEVSLAARDARIAELDTRLALAAKSETDADKKPPAPPKEFPAGALKPARGDQRRVGG